MIEWYFSLIRRSIFWRPSQGTRFITSQSLRCINYYIDRIKLDQTNRFQKYIYYLITIDKHKLGVFYAINIDSIHNSRATWEVYKRPSHNITNANRLERFFRPDRQSALDFRPDHEFIRIGRVEQHQMRKHYNLIYK